MGADLVDDRGEDRAVVLLELRDAPDDVPGVVRQARDVAAASEGVEVRTWVHPPVESALVDPWDGHRGQLLATDRGPVVGLRNLSGAGRSEE
jgi:hypothetical protein